MGVLRSNQKTAIFKLDTSKICNIYASDRSDVGLMRPLGLGAVIVDDISYWPMQ